MEKELPTKTKDQEISLHSTKKEITDHHDGDHDDGTKGKKKSRKFGRAARRRRAKTRSIDLALEALLKGEPENKDEAQQRENLPTDRSQSLPGVLQRRQENQIEFDKCEPLLVSQLGYMPGNAVEVVGITQNLQHLYPCLHRLLVKVDSKRYSNIHVSTDLVLPKNKHKHGDDDDDDDNDDAKSKTDKHESCDVSVGSIASPTALKLYPLAIRDVFQGGKSGRKFKSRKRGHDQITEVGSKFPDEPSENSAIEEESESHTNNSIKNSNFPSSNTNANVNIVIEPFPTMYWLTHPLLRTLISQIELGSIDNVTQVQQKLASSPQHLSKMKIAHESYGRERWELLTEDDKRDVLERNWKDAVGSVRGVAGIRKYETVKCLHTHSAHYLAFLGQNLKTSSRKDRKGIVSEDDIDSSSGTDLVEENLIGKWTLEAVEKLVRNLEATKDTNEAS